MATQALITINAVAGSNTDLPLNALVQLNNIGAGGETTYTWSILTQPAGPADVLSSTIIQAPTFTPTKEGSYLIRLVVNLGLPDEKTNTVVAAVRELETRSRIPAANETSQVDVNVGWSHTAADEVLQRVTRFKDNGIGVGKAGVAGLVPGSVVWVNDSSTIATGLPGQRPVPVFSVANANVAVEAAADVFVVLSGVDGSATPALGDLIRVLQFGLYTGITYVGPAPAVGDQVFLSDTGTMSLTAGTIPKVLGSVVRAGGGTYDAWLDPAAGTAISGPAGGVLGYPGSTYPNPNGLAPGDGVWAAADLLPIKAGALGVTMAVDDSATTSQAGCGFTLRSGAGGPSAAGVAGGPGGTMRLRGNNGAQGSTGASNGGLGGFVILTAGGGGSATAGTGTPGYGGGLTFQPGVGGAGNATNGGGRAGNVAFNGAVGGAGVLASSIGGEGSAFNVVTGNGGAPGGDAGDAVIQGGAGGISSVAYTGGEGGSVSLVGGAGGARGVAGLPGNGGSVGMFGGLGGAGSGGSNGGVVTITGGSAGAGGNGGSVNINTGSSGTAGNGGSGGNLTVTAASGAGNASGAAGQGGSFIVTLGNGGSGTTASANGGYFSVTAGTGGDSNGVVNAANGGQVDIIGGNGGAWDGVGTGAPGYGGTINIQAGNGGNGNGTFGNITGGGVGIQAGLGTANAATGQVIIADAPIISPGLPPTLDSLANGSYGGSVTVATADSGMGVVGVPPQNAGGFQVYTGKGGDANTAVANGSDGGAAGFVTGAGGAGKVGNSGGTGGGVLFVTGQGGDANGGTAGTGGPLIVLCGNAGAASGGGVGGTGGGIVIGCGQSTGNASGAIFGLTAGKGSGTGAGGIMLVSGGSNTTSGAGGSAAIVGGSGATTGGGVSVQAGNGATADGDVVIGTVNGAKVQIGIPGRDVQTSGRNVEATTAPTVAAPLPVNSPTVLLTNAGAVDLGAAALNVVTSGITAGTRVTFIQTGAGSTKFNKDGGNTTYLQLSNASHTLGQYDSLTLIWTGAFWVEVGYVNI